jgi:sec-independent protein translocase protein TatA
MFGIGFQELCLILVIVLVVFGPGKLPDISRAVGKSINEFRQATTQIKKDLDGTDKH